MEFKFYMEKKKKIGKSKTIQNFINFNDKDDPKQFVEKYCNAKKEIQYLSNLNVFFQFNLI